MNSDTDVQPGAPLAPRAHALVFQSLGTAKTGIELIAEMIFQSTYHHLEMRLAAG